MTTPVSLKLCTWPPTRVRWCSQQPETAPQDLSCSPPGPHTVSQSGHPPTPVPSFPTAQPTQTSTSSPAATESAPRSAVAPSVVAAARQPHVFSPAGSYPRPYRPTAPGRRHPQSPPTGEPTPPNYVSTKSNNE